MKRKFLTLLMLCALCVAGVSAQGRKGMCINEVMVQNDSNYVDDYGMHHAWVELFNSTFGTVNISSMYLTDDIANPKKYQVPRGDVLTKIPPRQHVVFWCDNEPNKGTFHVSFALKPGQVNKIYLVDSDGINVIDSVAIPANLPAGASYALKKDGVKGDWEVRDGSKDNLYVTPSSNNKILEGNEKIEKFQTQDSSGVAMTIMAMAIVFGALAVLSLCFMGIGFFHAKKARQKKEVATGAVDETKPLMASLDSGEEIAAICMALHEHLNMHDKEDFVLTINKVKRAYSPWNSKIYSLRELPHK